jgi:hypothetical protein
MHSILKFILEMEIYMFRTVPLSIIRSYLLYAKLWYMSYMFVDSLRAGSACSALTSVTESPSLILELLKEQHDSQSPNSAILRPTVLFGFREVSVSKVCPEICYPDWEKCVVFLSPLP